VKKLEEILLQARQLWTLQQVAVQHRLGRVTVGEISVAVAVSSAHRLEAFAACRFIIDSLKELVPIWKKDVNPVGGEQWKES
jgi:molybdopterin synthase catalytic subunit